MEAEEGQVVNCAVYAGGRRVGDLAGDLASIRDWVAKPDHVVWVGLYEPSEAILQTLQVTLGLHELAVEDAHGAHQRPKLEEYGEALFIVLRTVEWNADDHSVVF